MLEPETGEECCEIFAIRFQTEYSCCIHELTQPIATTQDINIALQMEVVFMRHNSSLRIIGR